MGKKLKISLLFLSIILITTLIKTFAVDDKIDYNTNLSNSNKLLLQSNYFTHPINNDPYNQPDIDMTNYEELMENDHLKVYIDNKSLALRILNKDTNYIWMSDLDNVYDERLNKDWIYFVRSAVSFTYLNKKDAVKYDNILESKYDIIIKKNITSNRAEFSLDFTYCKIRMKLVIGLEGESLTVKIPSDSIEEYGDNKLFTLQLYPFLGAVKFDEIPGYSFIPDGSGALVQFQRDNIMESSFRTKFYGNDVYINSANRDILPLNLPVYGIVHGHNQNAIFTEVKSGAEFGEFVMQFAGEANTTDFNFSYVDYIFREKFYQPLIDDQGVTKITNDMYKYDIEMKHTFLSNENANYIGMAKTYKEEIFNGEEENTSQKSNIPMHLDILASESYKAILFQKFIKMTQLNELVSINQELNQENIDNLLITYKGYNAGGLSKIDVDNFKFDRRLYDLDSIDKLDNFYLYYQPSLVYEKEADKSNLLTRINREYMLNDHYYYNSNKSILEGINRAFDYSLKIGANIVLDGISHNLYSDLKNGITRRDMMNKLNESITKDIPMFNPSSYLFSKTSDYLNISNSSNQYLFVTDSVPFIQTVLRGNVDYFSENINNSGNRKTEILKCVEYGTYPSYMISSKSSYLLKDTISKDIFGTEYSLYKDTVISEYKYLNNALKYVIGSEIMSHNALDEGVIEVVYENGIVIVVNYNIHEVSYGDYIIDGKDYKVIGDINE